MSTVTTPRSLARPLDDAAGLASAVDALLAGRAEPPVLFGLGEPTHGIVAFPLLRNELLPHLVEKGYRAVVLETDFFAASLIDEYVGGGPAELGTVLETGFSHGFGAVPGNRELLRWLRAHNAGRAPRDRVRCYGFDAPTEYAGAPSPRRALGAVLDRLPAALRPASAGDLDALLGDESEWLNPAAMYDANASIGNSERVRALRIIADDLADALRRAAPALHAADPSGYFRAAAHARTAQGLLRYHVAMADAAADRMETLISVRAEIMAENLLAIVERERERGPVLVFAHNAHLQRAQSHSPVGGAVNWANTGALVGLALGERYVFVASDANPRSEPGTLQHLLAEATDRRALFPAPALRAALDPSTRAGEPIVPGHIPLRPSDLDGADAVVFIADTDGVRVRYW
ncbi:erythromycin esterase family protein [Nocardia acidivorans]|uniref:erythromycin esterase family protein n=1 Tax=Nocardia acidivorans TaxID=404580 RepID=UPI0008314D4D|nr:erythromycin esterase family protein [Nocardia acidivorans]